MAEVQQVVSQRAPQGCATLFFQAAHCDLGESPISSEVGVNGFAGGCSLTVNLFAGLGCHALFPCLHGGSIAGSNFQFSSSASGVLRHFGRYEQLHSSGLCAFQIALVHIAAVEQMLLDFTAGSLLDLLPHGFAQPRIVAAFVADLHAQNRPAPHPTEVENIPGWSEA